jgi:hypothetical protein
MPRANPYASLDAAVRHLFRHLDDVSELKRNPLVKRLLEKAEDCSIPHEIAVPDLIRRRLRVVANAYRDAAQSEGRSYVQRQTAILSGCLEGRSVKEIAHSLKTSLRQCYRDRAAIFRQVGSALQGDFEPESALLCTWDVFEAEMERAAARVANGDYSLARRQYTSLVNEGSTSQQMRALCNRADLELDLGMLLSAEESLADLHALLAKANSPLKIELSATAVSLQLLEARLAWEKGSFTEALSRLSCAQIAAAEYERDPAERMRGLYADIALECAIRAFDLGDFNSTTDRLAAARRAGGSVSMPHHRMAAILLMESAVTFASARPGSGDSLHSPLTFARRAHSLALRCHSIKWRLKVEMFLTALQRSSLNVMRSGASILSVARELRNPRLFAMLSLEFADMLLETPAWRQSELLMRAKLPRGTFYAGSFSMLKAVYGLKMGLPAAARRHAEAAHVIASRAAAPRFQASTLRLLGYASYLLGQREEATDFIAAAVPLAERYGSAPARLKTLRMAGLITGNRKYTREAEMLATVIK